MPYPKPLNDVIYRFELYEKNSNTFKVYTILDTAINELIYKKLIDTPIQKQCLFNSTLEYYMPEVAPYIVLLEVDNIFSNWLLDNCRGNNWGIFLISKSDIKTLAEHYSNMTIVSHEDGNEYFFRYYDPRVLRLYLPTCTNNEFKQFKGPSDYIFFDDKDGLDWEIWPRN